MKVFKRKLRCLVFCSVIRQVEGSSERVRLKKYKREVAEERMTGRNGGDQRHELKRRNAGGAARVRREGKGEGKTMAVAS
eukprot:4963496-Pleurochrysis_carterae.AAC.1